MSTILLLTIYCLLILGASLAGGWIPLVVRLTHTRLQVATSFVAGLMLGIGVLHMIPHAWHQLKSVDRTVHWMLAGLLVMFFVQRYFHFHHHDVAEDSPEHHHPHEHQLHSSTLADQSAHQLSWAGAALGLSLHTVINGVALAASVEAGAGAALAGLGTFLVIFLHKPFDSMAISMLMAAGGWPKAPRHLVNVLFALAIPAGILIFHLSAGQFSASLPEFIGAALAFAGGSFICISASDLLPELQFHAHDRGKLSVALLAGLGLAVLVGQFEHQGHDHPESDAPDRVHEMLKE